MKNDGEMKGGKGGGREGEEEETRRKGGGREWEEGKKGTLYKDGKNKNRNWKMCKGRNGLFLRRSDNGALKDEKPIFGDRLRG